MIDFDQCRKIFASNETLQKTWGYTGPIIGIDRSPTTQITREGCIHLCGAGTNYYAWKDVSSTITTWLLPVVGTLLQAPFESNATRRTMLAITRWVGSPIASLSYVLWNIKVSAKAALMVDMAVKYDETPDRKTDFGSMRDSMYLLLVMNQYTLKPSKALAGKEAEGLLRIALFSKDLKLTDTDKSLRQMRRILARELREMRRRGAVPVFISTMWFLFAFALSVESAFGNLGQNTTAHDLALGCLLAWFPILIMASIVDRNPIATTAIRKKLNALIDHVRHSLRNETHRTAFITSFRDEPNFHLLQRWVSGVAEKSEDMYDFFDEFAGQARIRWHYGAAHPILSDIENCYIASKGRNWLANEREARSHLVLGSINEEGLLWFDIREFWQVGSAVLIVAGSCGGAFVLSFFTPTVGLGCRSGGYTIFFSIALGLLIVEMVVWLVLSPYCVESEWVRSASSRLHRNRTFAQWEDGAVDWWGRVKRVAERVWVGLENGVTRGVVWGVMLVPWRNKKEVRVRVVNWMEDKWLGLREMSPQRKWEVFFFRPVEATNTIWLIYIVLAQTFGLYKTCNCVTSTWGGGGGYLDFSVQDTSNSRWVLFYWTAGTLLTSLVMSFSMFYITVEWCQQSFLSTEIYADAMSGLRLTRSYRSLTSPLRLTSRFISKFTFDPLESLGVFVGLIKMRQKTLLWTKSHTWDPPTPDTATTRIAITEPPLPPPFQHIGSPTIHLSDYSSLSPTTTHAQNDTPALAHSLFPPALTTRRSRNESDASLNEPMLPIYSQYHRSSDDSYAPLIQRPEDIHRSRAGSGSASTGDRRRSSDVTDPQAGWEDVRIDGETEGEQRFGAWLGMQGGGERVYTRQGYRRANSDPGMPPVDGSTTGTIAEGEGEGEGVEGGLGIRGVDGGGRQARIG